MVFFSCKFCPTLVIKTLDPDPNRYSVQNAGFGSGSVIKWIPARIRNTRLNVSHLERGGFEGRLSDKESVHDTAEGPHVGREAVTLLVQHLRGDVVRGPAYGPATQGGRHHEPCCCKGQNAAKPTVTPVCGSESVYCWASWIRNRSR